MTDDRWVVRLGTVRGAGAYVRREAPVNIHGAVVDDRMCFRRRNARRFTMRFLADRYARAFGGRVVRLRRKVER